jgi:hypothetical protein
MKQLSRPKPTFGLGVVSKSSMNAKSMYNIQTGSAKKWPLASGNKLNRG